MKLSKMPEKLWTYLTVDFIMKLLLVAKKNVILVVCNKLSKITYFIAMTEETFAINNKVYLTTKISLFIVNYRRELKMRIDIR